MIADSKAMDFKKLASEVTDSNRWWGNERFFVWAGECPEDQLLVLLKEWSIPGEDIPYVLLEYMDHIVFRDWWDERTHLNAERVQELERGRMFGERGDLSFARGEKGWRWYFVGKPEVRPPQGFDSPVNNFWTAESEATFLMWEEKAMLWGSYKEQVGRWQEDRVARALLEYPVKVPENSGKEGCRVLLNYRTFSRGKGVEFVWYVGLETYPPAEGING